MRASLYLCVRETLCVCMCVHLCTCMCVSEGETLCVCICVLVCVTGRDPMCVHMHASVYSCVRGRPPVCLCVCTCACVHPRARLSQLRGDPAAGRAEEPPVTALPPAVAAAASPGVRWPPASQSHRNGTSVLAQPQVRVCPEKTTPHWPAPLSLVAPTKVSM